MKLGGQPSGDLLPVGGRAGLPVQQHQFASAQPDGHAWPGNRTVPRRTGIAPGPGTPQPEHDQPSGQCDQPETGQAVKQHRRQGLAGTQPGGYQRQAERSLSDSEPAGRDVEALRGDARAVDQQKIVPGDGGAGGADAHGEDRRVGEPVGQGQAGRRHPAGRGQPERTQSLCPGPDGLVGFGGGSAQHPGSLPEHPSGWPLERAAQPRAAHGRDRRDEDGYREHAAEHGDRCDRHVPRRQAATDHDEGRRGRGDHPAGQQRPAGQRGIRALPGEAAEGEGRGQGGSGQRNRDRHRVGRIGGGQHRPDAHADAAGREQPAQHDREGGHGRGFKTDGGRDPEPVQMSEHRKRRC